MIMVVAWNNALAWFTACVAFCWLHVCVVYCVAYACACACACVALHCTAPTWNWGIRFLGFETGPRGRRWSFSERLRWEPWDWKNRLLFGSVPCRIIHYSRLGNGPNGFMSCWNLGREHETCVCTTEKSVAGIRCRVGLFVCFTRLHVHELGGGTRASTYKLETWRN